MSFFSDEEAALAAFVKTEYAAAKAFITKEETAIKPMIDADLTAAWNAGKQVAVAVVIEFAKDVFAAMTGQEKLAEVKANVAATLKTAGLKAEQAVIDTVAQNAFAFVSTQIPLN